MCTSLVVMAHRGRLQSLVSGHVSLERMAEMMAPKLVDGRWRKPELSRRLAAKVKKTPLAWNNLVSSLRGKDLACSFFLSLSLSLSLSTFLRGRYLRLIVKEQVQGLPRI